MIPLRSDVNTLARVLLGDPEGEMFPDSRIPPYLNLAYQELFSRLMLSGSREAQREAYWLLPAYTGKLKPSAAGVSNFGSPVEFWERGSATAYGVSSATPGARSCALVLASPLPGSVVTGTQVDICGMSGLTEDANDDWTITVTDPTHIVLNGCSATGAYTGGGQAIHSTEAWVGPLVPFADTDNFPTIPSSSLGVYSWRNGSLHFPPCSTARELWIQFQLSAALDSRPNASATDSMGVDDSLSFLANRTAQYLAASVGNAREASLQRQADYFLGMMMANQARGMQLDEPIIPAPFRRKRNARLSIW